MNNDFAAFLVMVLVVVGVILSLFYESAYPAIIAFVAIAALILKMTWWRYRP